MSKAIKIQCTGFGVSVDNVFNIYYITSTSSTLSMALNAYGNPAQSISQGQLLTGYTLVLPDNATYVYVYDMAGVCAGRYSAANLPGVSPTPTQTVSPTPSQTPTKTPSQTPSITPTKTPSNTPSNTASQTPSITPTNTQTPSNTPSQTPSQTPSITLSTTQTPSQTPSNTPSNTQTPSQTPSNTPSNTQTPSQTPSNTPSNSQTPSNTPSNTPSITPTISNTPSITPTISITSTPSITPTISKTPSITPTISITPTVTATPSITPTISITPSITPTSPSIQFGKSTTTYATTNIACEGTVTGVIYQPPAYGTTPTADAQLYTDSELTTTWTPPSTSGYYLFQYGGSTKWAVVMGATGVVNTVIACSGVPSVTPTTTTTPTISNTPSNTPSQSPSNTPEPTPTQASIGFGKSTTTYSTTNSACNGTVTGVIYQPPAYGTTPTADAQLYTDSGLTTTWTPPSTSGYYLFQYGGSTKWAVVMSTSGVISSVIDCSGVPSVTPSITITPTVTPTVTPSETLPIVYTYYNVYTVDVDCNTTYSFDGYSTTPYSNGFYNFDGNLYYFIGISPTETVSSVEGATASSCTPPATYVNLSISSTFSLDISISDVTVDGVSATYLAGTAFPINSGDPSGTYRTTLTGTRTIVVYYSSSIPGQNITLVDSNSSAQCQGNSTGTNSMIFNDVAVNGSGDVFITASDGACP